MLEYQPTELNRKSTDYVLKNNGKNVAIVEAKNIDIDIEYWEHREQADGYARYAEVKFFVLTSGIRWLLYERDLMTSLESLKPIVSFDVVHDEPYQCALAAISMWRPNLASDSGPSKATESVFALSKSEPDQSNSKSNKQQEQQLSDESSKDDDKRYPFASENRLYPQSTNPTKLKIDDNPEKIVQGWKDVMHEVATWLVDEGKLSNQHCPILIGKRVKKTFIDHKEAVNPDGTPFGDPRELSKGFILQRRIETDRQWPKLKEMLIQFNVDRRKIEVFY